MRVAATFVLTAGVLLLALPAAASAARWQVFDKSGEPVGRRWRSVRRRKFFRPTHPVH